MKLSRLLETIEPITANRLNTGSGGQESKNGAETYQVPTPLPEDNPLDSEIGSIHYRAQEVQPGGMFVAIEGQTADGHDYMQQALKRGALAFIAQREPPQPFLNEIRAASPKSRPIVIQVPNTRIALADLAACFFGHPSRGLTLIGITGTNGKTTVAYLIESILLQADFKVGVIGTINYRYGEKTFANPMTTPESMDLQRILSEMRRDGVTHVIAEVSSHAMDLYRIKSCWFDIAVFTNLSQDHLDFHGDMQAYWSTKKRLFTEYLTTGPKKENASAVINCDDARGRELSDSLPMSVVRTGATPDCEIKSENIQCNLNGTDGRLPPQGGVLISKLPSWGYTMSKIFSARPGSQRL